ncbi:hypothetical protein AMJ57_05645, partial [Parcubacteria bacterium SG8_24]
SPPSPFIDDVVTISATATDDVGVTEIKLYLDGTNPEDLRRVCTFPGGTSPANCSVGVGMLSRGSHTTTAIATDTLSATDQDTDTFNVAGYTGSNQISLSRYKAGESNVDFGLSFTLAGSSTGTLTVTFPTGFTVTQAATSGSCVGGTVDTFGYTASTLTAVKTGCSAGALSISGARITNPLTPGEYIITWSNDNGSGSVYITDDDQVTVSGSIDPVISFNVGSQAAAAACDGSFSGDGGSLPLGTLTTSGVASSDRSSVPHICSRVSTNASSGATVTVRSLYGALYSPSSTDQISSSTTTLTAGTAGYGLCVGTGGTDTGKDTTTPAGADPTASSPFDAGTNNCSATAGEDEVGGLTTGYQNLWTLASPSQNAFARLYLKAAISPVTPAHSDYQDTLTFVVTGTY